jgi:ABC-type multidrug transport system permease subunit
MVDLKKILKPYSDLTGEKTLYSSKDDTKNKKEGMISKIKKKEFFFIKKEKQKKEEEKTPKEIKLKLNKIEPIKEKDYHLTFGPLTKILTMMKKDFKLLLRSKTSSLIVIFGPLILILLLGFSFNTSSIYDIKIGTYSESYSELTNNLIQNLNDQQYKTIKADSEKECIDKVKFGEYHVCAIFPKDMAVSNEADNLIRFYVDKSRMNVAYLISGTIFSRVISESSKLSKSLTGEILSVVDSTKTTLTSNKGRLDEVITKNKENSQKVVNLKTEFDGLDLSLDVNSVNLTQIEDAVDEVQNKTNLSTRTFKPINDAIDDLSIGLSLLKEEVKNSITLKSNTIKSLSEIKSLMSDENIAMSHLQSSIDSVLTNINNIAVTNTENIVEPIKTTIEPVSAEKTHLSYMFPTLIVLVIMFISLLLSSSMVLREKLDKAYFRNFITPTNDIWFLIGGYLTSIFIIMLQVAIICGVVVYFTGIATSTILNLLVILLVVCSVFIFIGTFIGYLFNSEETSTLAAISLGSIMLFFSSTVLPIEALPAYIREITKYNPFVLSEEIIRKVMLFGEELAQLQEPLLVLGGFIIGLFILSWITREVKKMRYTF